MNLAMTWATMEFRIWSSIVHYEYMSKKKLSCHLEVGTSSMVNRYFEFLIDE